MTDDTKFPEYRRDRGKIYDWFKRCLEDFPHFVALNEDDYEVVEWKEKWFGQWKEHERK